MRTIEYREGLTRVRVELVNNAITVLQTSVEFSTSKTVKLSELSPQVDQFTRRDPAIKSAIVIVSLLVFAAIFGVGMVRFTLSWSLFVISFVPLIGGVWAAYFLTPIRKYSTYRLRSGVTAFVLRNPEAEQALKDLKTRDEVAD